MGLKDDSNEFCPFCDIHLSLHKGTCEAAVRLERLLRTYGL